MTYQPGQSEITADRCLVNTFYCTPYT